MSRCSDYGPEVLLRKLVVLNIILGEAENLVIPRGNPTLDRRNLAKLAYTGDILSVRWREVVEPLLFRGE